MSFIFPQPCTTQVDEDGQCCPNTFIGFCLDDGTPISITIQSGAQLGWTNLLTAIFTPGPPPAGTVVCSQDQVLATTNFEYPEDSPHVSGDIGAFVLAVRNDGGIPLAADGDYIPFTTDSTGALRVTGSGGGFLTCLTDSVTICPGDDPIEIIGTVTVNQGTSPWVTSLDAATLAALETITVLQGTSPWIVSATDLDIRNLDCATDSITICPGDDPIEVVGTVELGATTLAALETITVNQGTSPWVIGDGGGSLTVDAVDFDIRDLVFATDKVDVSGSTVALDAGTLAALETITVLQGTTPWTVSGTVELGATTLAALETITVLQGTSPWVTSLDAATLAALESITVQNGAGAAAVNIQDGGNSITVDGTVTVTNTGGTLTNGAETAVSSVAVQVLAANAVRKKYLVENTGSSNVRVGVSGVTTTTGFRLVPGGSMLMEMPDCPTQAIFAIRETALDSIVFAQEVT